MPFIVLYDANVLVGNSQRDLLIRIARAGLVQAKWTNQILDEAIGAVHKSRPDIAAETAPDADLDFIAHARQDVPRLLAEVRRLRAVRSSSDR